jgi:hypothetical protein
VDFSKLSREDWMVGGGGILLIIFLFALPFYSFYLYDPAATSTPGSIWGIFALIVTIVVVADWALAVFSPETAVPSPAIGRPLTRTALAGLADLFILIKLLQYTGNISWGFFVDIIVAAIVTYGAWAIAQGKSTAVKAL